MTTIFKALIFTPKDEQRITIMNPGYLVVSPNGTIEEVTKIDPRKKYKGHKYLDYSGYLICPGFIDTHNHLPQYAFAGIGDKELLPWLEHYTFPREKTLKKRAVATQAAETFFEDLIQNGTTTTLTYVTIHKSATDIAFQSAKKKKIRAIIGKVMMDQNSPAFLTEKTQTSIEESAELIDKWHGKNGRLFYALTPRFAITCSFSLLEKTATLARKKGVYIQTHLSENPNEIALIKTLFPKFKNYTDVYYKAGLLGPKTIMAHCIHLTPSEINLIKKTQTRVSHCPTSNRFLMSGIMPFRKYQNAGIIMGLGTDVAGGYSLSMINEMKEAIENSKTFSVFSKKTIPPMTLAEAFYLATLGGAKTLSMDHLIGSLEKGKKADFIVANHQATDSMNNKSTYIKPEQILSKLIYRGNASIIKEVYIEGEKIHEKKD